MAVELGPHQIRVNAIQPTLVPETSMGQQGLRENRVGVEAVRQRTPYQQVAKVEHIVNLVLYLLSEA